jgi:hypothetical protein
MSIVVALATLILLAVVIAVISGPLRVARRGPDAATLRRAELEAAREAKYREIRDTELDFATGKLSVDDHAAIEGALRAEAMEILRELDALSEPAPEE